MIKSTDKKKTFGKNGNLVNFIIVQQFFALVSLVRENLGELRENKKHKNRAYDTFDHQDQFLWNVSLKHIFHFFLAHRNLEHALPSLEAAMQAVNSIDKGQ